MLPCRLISISLLGSQGQMRAVDFSSIRRGRRIGNFPYSLSTVLIVREILGSMKASFYLPKAPFQMRRITILLDVFWDEELRNTPWQVHRQKVPWNRTNLGPHRHPVQTGAQLAAVFLFLQLQH